MKKNVTNPENANIKFSEKFDRIKKYILAKTIFKPSKFDSKHPFQTEK